MSGPDIPRRYCSDLPQPRRGVLSGKSPRTSRRWRLFFVRFVSDTYRHEKPQC
jgi:hypothetical protein